MLIFVPPTVCGSLWHNCPGIWTPCWFYNIYKEQRTLLISSSTLILSKVEPIFSRKWVWSQFLINLLLLKNVLSPLIQSGSSRNQFIVGEFQTRRSAAPDSHRRHQTLADQDVSLLSLLHPIRLSTVSSVRHPMLPGFHHGYIIYFSPFLALIWHNIASDEFPISHSYSYRLS